jgi:WG containing repeat
VCSKKLQVVAMKKKHFLPFLLVGSIIVSIYLFTASKSLSIGQNSIASGTQPTVIVKNTQADSQSLLPIVQNGKWGYIDRTGKLTISAQFEAAEPFSEGLASVQVGGKWGYIDRTGKLVIKPQFSDAEEFVDGLAIISFGKTRTGSFIDRTGKLLTPNGFDSVDKFSEGLARVGNSNGGIKPGYHHGYIDRTGKLVIPMRFGQMTGEFYDGRAMVGLYKGVVSLYKGESWKYGYIDTTGKMVIAAKYDGGDDPILWDKSDFSQGMAAVRQNDKWGYINREGKTVIPFRRAYSAGPFNEGIAVLKYDNGTAKYIDQKGKIVRSVYEERGHRYGFENGLGLISARGKWGYIDRTGKVVIKPRYLRAGHFREGFAAVNDKDSGGDFYIDKTGKPISSKRFTQCGEFQNGAARVKIDDKMGYINPAGKYIYEPNEASKNPPT